MFRLAQSSFRLGSGFNISIDDGTEFGAGRRWLQITGLQFARSIPGPISRLVRDEFQEKLPASIRKSVCATSISWEMMMRAVVTCALCAHP